MARIDLHLIKPLPEGVSSKAATACKPLSANHLAHACDAENVDKVALVVALESDRAEASDQVALLRR